eukprot:364925-Chlamydomonas_euryale.AAC.9
MHAPPALCVPPGAVEACRGTAQRPWRDALVWDFRVFSPRLTTSGLCRQRSQLRRRGDVAVAEALPFSNNRPPETAGGIDDTAAACLPVP